MSFLKNWYRKRKLKKELILHDKSYIKKPIELEEPLEKVTYRCEIRLLNHEVIYEECTVTHVEDLAKMFLENQCNVLGDGKVLWYNPDTIVSFCAIEKEKKEGEI